MHREAVTLAMAGADLTSAEAAFVSAGMAAATRRDLALIAVRAASMRDLSGVMAQIADALSTTGVRLFATGDSHNSVLCLIQADRVTDAIRELCRTFSLDESAVIESRAAGERAA